MSDEQSNNPPPSTSTAALEEDHVMLDSGDGDVLARTENRNKRKIEDVDVEMEDDNHKRRRTDHDRQGSDVTGSDHSGTRSGFGPLYKLCQTRKAPCCAFRIDLFWKYMINASAG